MRAYTRSRLVGGVELPVVRSVLSGGVEQAVALPDHVITGDGGGGPGPGGDISPALAAYLPAAGLVRPGFYVSGNNVTTAHEWSHEGSRADVIKPDIRAYYSLASGSVPTAAHASMAVEGHPIHCPVALNGNGITAAIPGRGIPAPARQAAGKGIWTYEQVLTGQLDGYWEWLADQFKAVDGLIVSSLNIEPENVSETTGKRESFSYPLWYQDRVALGDAAVRVILREYADAYRYVVHFMRDAGVTNVVWSQNWAALAYSSQWRNDVMYPAMWPGSDVVDMLGWDPYVNTPASQSWVNKLQTTLNYLRNGGLDSSYYPAARADITSMPWHLPETGCTPTSDAAAIAWINAIPAALATVPEIRAIAWFSSEGTESTTIHTRPAVRAAYAEMCSSYAFGATTAPTA